MVQQILTPSIIAKEALFQLENNLVMGNLVHRDYRKEFVKIGETITIRKPGKFVVTDGGSVQEECAYLGKPCLLFRKRTERIDGLGENVCLSGLNPETLRAFVREYPRYRRPPAAIEERPSDTVIDFLLSRGYA